MQNTGKSQRYDAEWKKPVSKGYVRISPDSIYITFWKEKNYRDREEINGWLRFVVKREDNYRGTA